MSIPHLIRGRRRTGPQTPFRYSLFRQMGLRQTEKLFRDGFLSC